MRGGLVRSYTHEGLLKLGLILVVTLKQVVVGQRAAAVAAQPNLVRAQRRHRLRRAIHLCAAPAQQRAVPSQQRCRLASCAARGAARIVRIPVIHLILKQLTLPSNQEMSS